MNKVDFLVIREAFALPELDVIVELQIRLERLPTLAPVLVNDLRDQGVNLILVFDVLDVRFDVLVLVEKRL